MGSADLFPDLPLYPWLIAHDISPDLIAG